MYSEKVKANAQRVQRVPPSRLFDCVVELRNCTLKLILRQRLRIGMCLSQRLQNINDPISAFGCVYLNVGTCLSQRWHVSISTFAKHKRSHVSISAFARENVGLHVSISAFARENVGLHVSILAFARDNDGLHVSISAFAETQIIARCCRGRQYWAMLSSVHAAVHREAEEAVRRGGSSWLRDCKGV